MAMKTAAEAGEKLVARAGVASEDYLRGVSNPRRSWSTSASAAEANYNAGVTASMAKKLWGKGIVKTGDQGWMDGAKTKGTQRFASGVAAGQQKYVTGVAPFFSAIGALTLPPRGPRGSENNYQRAILVGKAQNGVRARA